MGSFCSCCCRKKETQDRNDVRTMPFSFLGDSEQQDKKYSWDTREKADPSNYTADSLYEAQLVKKPGEINGQQFIIKNCSRSKIYLFDYMSSLTIDDCSDCLFVCGPVKGSVFLRDSSNSTLVCASTQLRLRDCRQVNLYVGCESEPIIEASTNIVTAPYYLNYKGMSDHFESAQLSWVKATNWSNIYDYTPNHDLPNWSRYNKNTQKPEQFICPPLPMHEYTDINMSVAQNQSLVPVTEHFDPADTFGGDKIWEKREHIFKLPSGSRNNNNAKVYDDIREYYHSLVNSPESKKLIQVQVKNLECILTFFSRK